MMINVVSPAPEIVVLHCGFEGPCLDAGIIYVPPRMYTAAMSVVQDIVSGVIAPDVDVVRIITERAKLSEL